MLLPIRVAFSFSGAPDLVRALEAIEERASDFTPAWPLVDTAFHRVQGAQFASEGSHGGEPWKELAPSTQAKRRRLGIGPGHPILRVSGDLERSLTTLDSNALTVHTATSYRRGSLIPYAPWVNKARRIVRVTAADKEEIFRPIRVWLRGGEPGTRQLTAYAGTLATTGGAR